MVAGSPSSFSVITLPFSQKMEYGTRKACILSKKGVSSKETWCFHLSSYLVYIPCIPYTSYLPTTTIFFLKKKKNHPPQNPETFFLLLFHEKHSLGRISTTFPRFRDKTRNSAKNVKHNVHIPPPPGAESKKIIE